MEIFYRVTALTAIEDDDIQLVFAHCKRYPNVWLDAPKLLEAIRRSDAPQFTARRLHLATQALVASQCLVERESMGSPQWRFTPPEPSQRARDSVAPLIEEHVTMPTSTARSTSERGDAIERAIAQSQLRGLPARGYAYLLKHPDGAQTEALAKALRADPTAVSAMLGSLVARGFATRELLPGYPRRFRYSAVLDRKAPPARRRARRPASAPAASDRDITAAVTREPRKGSAAQAEAITLLGSGFDAELHLLRSVTEALEIALQNNMSVDRVRNAVEFALGRMTSG
jgi:hypothetical protein